ncbi:UNVERIFIED_CONTAM: hypothetical protein GTU68_057203 [Idotea baltica]|nr:hypothetical protein [Idotea baltica]
MRHFVDLAKKHDTIVCIVDYHALTSVSDAASLRENSLSLAAAYLAIGLKPDETIIFKQSDVPSVCELSWILACQFPLGLLERAHSVKDARAKNQQINAGRMFYPILMAADILLYKATLVPVGKDQKQHLEMSREVAQKFNQRYGEVFPVPEPYISETTGIIPGLDGRKMSKSYDNYIGLFETPKAAKKKIMRITTDSLSVEDKKDPEQCSVYQLYSLLASEQESADIADKYRSGGYGYGEAKLALVDIFEREIGPIRERYLELMDKPDDLRDMLAASAKKADAIASETMAQMHELLGVA